MTWAIDRDPTHLSSLQQRLQATHERLLQMDGTQCPPYIALNNLQVYKSVFGPQGFCCRFRSCPASESGLPSIVLRTNHETQHFPTHSCKECDFSVRGFKSKGALNRHTMKYHPKLRQMELPRQLLPAARPGARSLPSSRRRVAKSPSPTTPQHDALTDVGQPQPVIAQLLQSVEDSTLSQVDNEKNTMQRHIITSLQQQGPFTGWQATMTVETRAMQVRLLIDALSLLIVLPKAMQVALSFEQKAFIQSATQEAYGNACKEKLSQIHDTRQRAQQMGQNLNFPPQLQHAILTENREAHKQIVTLYERSQDPKRPLYTDIREIMKTLEDLNSEPQGTIDLEHELRRHEDWMRKGKILFGKANAPLHILEVHMKFVEEKNNFCFDLNDTFRPPVEPASRETSPNKDLEKGGILGEDEKPVFCICRQPENGMMIMCENCLEW